MPVWRRLTNVIGGKMKLCAWILLIFIVSCTPLPRDGDVSETLPPDTAVTSPPVGGDMSTNESQGSPFAPQPGDENLTRGNVFIDEASLVIRESYPPQVSLSIRGGLPTPCHQLRVEIASPDQENNIRAEAYSVVDPNMICTQVIKSFQEYIDLGTFPSGHYSVWLNGEVVGEFDG